MIEKLRLSLEVVGGAVGLAAFTALALALLLVLASEVHADEPEFEWITGTVGEDRVNLIRNQITDEWSWTTGTIGDDSVNLNELRISDEWDWTTGTIGEESINLNSLKVQWDDDE